MSTNDIKIDAIKITEWLGDIEARLDYGSVTIKYDLAASLVAARKMKKLTQVALANIAGVSQAYIAKLESGEANPTIGRVGAILAAIWLKAEINIMPLVPQEADSHFKSLSNDQQSNILLDNSVYEQSRNMYPSISKAASRPIKSISHWQLGNVFESKTHSLARM